uniref:Uncharacterized protein n=1 Tax=Brassica oleracea TaxID=3712 RepID=A0A3P6ENJ6_BRAOL|nr:unnamed protein product [Brassica oleracea]
MEVHPHDESFDLQEIHSRVKELEYVHRNCIDESGESIPCGFEALAQDYALQLETKVKEIVEDYFHVDSMDVEESCMLLLLCCLMTRRVAVDVLCVAVGVTVVMRFLLLLKVATIPPPLLLSLCFSPWWTEAVMSSLC